MTSLFIILFMFIRNSSSKNGRVNFDFQLDFRQKKPDSKLVNLFLKLVLPVIPKRIQSIFLILP